MGFLEKILIIVVLISVCIIITLVIDKIRRNSIEHMLRIMNEQQNEYFARQYDQIIQYQQETRKMRHEMKNNYILIETMANNNDTTGIINYIDQFLNSKKDKNICHTGNMVVDSVINYKAGEAERCNIDLNLNINIPTQFDTNNVRLCGLLGNAIDNAIDACQKVPEDSRFISISMKVEKRNLFIEIVNSFDGKVIMGPLRRKSLLTRKENSLEHGFGISIMKELLGQNFGTMETSWDDKHFTIRMILYTVL